MRMDGVRRWKQIVPERIAIGRGVCLKYLSFAYDLAIVQENEEGLQRACPYRLFHVCDEYDFNISFQKTKSVAYKENNYS